MPADRLLHPKLGHSDKVSRLTDFEFRVWTQYMLSADDYGVIRASAVTLQADNDALAMKKARVVELALQHVIEAGLVHAFEHQGRRYVYQRDWQDWQHIGYPRSTVNPLPPPEELAKCSPKTRKHFERRSSNDSENLSETSTPSRTRETATANGNGFGNGQKVTTPQNLTQAPADDVAERAGEFCRRYAELYPLHRRGARYLPKPALDFQKACDLCSVWPNDRLEKLAIVFLKTDHQFAQDGSRTIGQFAALASWCDDRLREVEAGV